MSLPESLTSYIDITMPTMEGWCSNAKATALAELVLTERPSLVVEIGVFAGRSLIAMALACDYNEEGRLVGIDPWQPAASVAGFEGDPANRDWWNAVNHDDIYNKCIASLIAMSVRDRVTLARLTSEQALPLVQCMSLSTPISLLHIDGNHSEACALYDVTHYLPLVAIGGTIVFDDTNWESTKSAQQELLKACDFVRFVDSGDGQQCGIYRKR